MNEHGQETGIELSDLYEMSFESRDQPDVGAFERVRRALSRYWKLRPSFTSSKDWLLGIYHRVLYRFPRLPLPGRQRVISVWIKGIPEPFYVRLGTTDWYVMEEIFCDRVYGPALDNPPEEVRQIIDLGANTGFTTRLWHLNFPNARIIAVEPDRENIEMFRRNLLNGPEAEGGALLVQACVGASPRRVSLDRSGGSWAYSMKEADQGEEDLIEVRSLPQIMLEGGMEGTIDILKCNIEGAEAEVFAHCHQWIGHVRRLAVQVHYPYTSEHLVADLERAGASFKLYHSKDCENGSKLLFLEQNV